MFHGLSAFPLTPTDEHGVDTTAYAALVARLADARVDSIGALGSTGGYAYLTREQRAHAAKIAVESADGVPVMVGIGALRTAHVLALAEDAQNAGASAVLLAPMTYQPLTDDEVFGLYEDVTRELSVPLCVYDNLATTHVRFSDELLGRIGQLPNVGSVKIPGEGAEARIGALRALLPSSVTVGVSGDWTAARGLNSGADVWYSVLGGLFPRTALAIARDPAGEVSGRLEPLWALFRRHGSLRVVSAAASRLGLVREPNLPRPLRELGAVDRREVVAVLDSLGLDG
ncbi:dihydrodipicolinate synthase family protein [Streptomyces acidiscabies]|uniref:Dihydrodipicolinate synthase n=1 Tax=Streptomyces acidiscabies TaxID=42234 RepID=A0A0L0K797_9ACTN|nr:dihydrodipicolinate synthase family protein [Streptomyces acidiscabies]KND33510.1 dihydrodipicolinate synthase [Streptomyces acidiscabies]